MHHVSRKILFVFFLAVFLVAAPGVVLYTAGYRYNPKNGHIVRTGVLAVSSTPRGAMILIDTVASGRTTPYVFSRIMPGEYAVTLTKDGYHAYDDDVVIESGKTTYASDITLFAASEPMLLMTEAAAAIVHAFDGNDALVLRRTGGSTEAWVYDIGSNAYQQFANTQGDTDEALVTRYRASEGNILLTRTAMATEVRRADAPDTILVILPPGDARVVQADGDQAVILGNNDMHYLVDLSVSDPILLSTRATAFDWQPDAGMFAWTDGTEVNVYSVSRNVSTFITRQSAPILDVALSASGTTVFAGMTAVVQTFLISDSGTHTTTLVTMDSVEQCFTSNASNELYVVGTLNGVRGIYGLALR